MATIAKWPRTKPRFKNSRPTKRQVLKGQSASCIASPAFRPETNPKLKENGLAGKKPQQLVDSVSIYLHFARENSLHTGEGYKMCCSRRITHTQCGPNYTAAGQLPLCECLRLCG